MRVKVHETMANSTMSKSAPELEAPSTTGFRRLVARVLPATVWAGPALFALVIGRWRAGRPVIGWDEAASWGSASRSIGQIFRLAGNIDGVIAPYYLFLHFWISIFGDSELSLRTPSYLAAACAVGLTAAIGRRLFNARIGVIAALLLAVIPAFSRYAQEIRPYGLALFFGCLSTWLLLRCMDKPLVRRWVGYGLAIMAIGLFHLLGLFLLFGHLAFVAIRWWKDRSRALAVGWIFSAGLASLACLPLALLGAGQRSQLFWLPPMRWDTFITLPEGLFFTAGVGWVVIGVAIAAAARQRGAVAALAITAAAPALCLYVAAFQTQLWVPRYVLYTLMAWCLLAAVTVGRSWLRTGIVFALVLALGYQVQLDMRSTTGHDTADYRVVARTVAQGAHPGDGIVYAPRRIAWSIRPAMNYYQLPQTAKLHDVLVTKTPAQNGSLTPQLCTDPSACLHNTSTIWVVLTDNSATDPLSEYNAELRNYVSLHYRIASRTLAGGATIIELVKRT